MSDINDNEQNRIKALRRYEILDTPPDGAFDRITALAAQLLQVPIAIVSLVDTDRIWFKSHHGIDAEEVARVPGLCSSVILDNVPYILSDASVDPRSLANPLVAGELGFRFYVGVPLTTHDNYNLGVLNVIDVHPRTITDQELNILKTLALIVMDEMELRLAARRIDALNQELLKIHEELKIKASHDALTKLWNQDAIMTLLTKSLALAQREGQPLAVLIADIDHFKSINDNYGHIAGDQVLTEVATRMTAAVRASDSLGRIGGEEFLLVMYPCDIKQAKITAERILNTICSTPFHIGVKAHFDIRVSLSAGIYSTELEPDIEAERLIKNADDALYFSKNSGRNRITVGRI